MSDRDDSGRTIPPELLALVDPVPEIADARLRQLLVDLARWFEWRGSRDPEGLAAESVYRALKRVADGAPVSQSELRAYVFGVAKLVAKEAWKAGQREQQMEPAEWDRWRSGRREQQRIETQVMLEQVQRLLSPDEWRILFRYCTDDDHTAQSRELGVTPGYLRVMIHRIRGRLNAKMSDT